VVLLVADPARIPLVACAGIQLLEQRLDACCGAATATHLPLHSSRKVVAGLTFGVFVLAVAAFALAIVLVRELYSYGLLGLRGQTVSVVSRLHHMPGPFSEA